MLQDSFLQITTSTRFGDLELVPRATINAEIKLAVMLIPTDRRWKLFKSSSFSFILFFMVMIPSSIRAGHHVVLASDRYMSRHGPLPLDRPICKGTSANGELRLTGGPHFPKRPWKFSFVATTSSTYQSSCPPGLALLIWENHTW